MSFIYSRDIGEEKVVRGVVQMRWLYSLRRTTVVAEEGKCGSGSSRCSGGIFEDWETQGSLHKKTAGDLAVANIDPRLNEAPQAHE